MILSFIEIIVFLGLLFVNISNIWTGLWTVDAGDLLTSAYQQRFAHAPGYPLYLEVVRLIHFLTGTSYITSGGVVSILCSVTSLFLLYKTATFFLKRNNRLILLSTLVVLASTRLWLLYAITQEVFTMTILFCCLTLYFFGKIITSSQAHFTDIAFLFISFSFGVFHQYILLLISPLIIIVLFRTRRILNLNRLFFLFVLLLVGFYPYLFFFQKAKSLYNPWSNSSTFVELLKIATRSQYGFFTFFNASPGIRFVERVNSIYMYVKTVFTEWYYFYFAIALFGIVLGAKKKETRLASLIFTYCWIVFSLFLFFVYTIQLDTYFTIAIVERFFLLSYPFIYLLVCIGLSYVYDIIRSRSPILRTCFLAVLFLSSIFFFVKTTRKISIARQNRFIDIFAKETIRLLPKNTILIVSADVYRFPLEYYSFVEKVRPDVTVVPSSVIGTETSFTINRNWLLSENVDISYKPRTVHQFIRVNSVKRPIYTNYDLPDLDGLTQIGPLFRYQYGASSLVSENKLLNYFHLFPEENKTLDKQFPLYGIFQTREYVRKGAIHEGKKYYALKKYNLSFSFFKEAHRLKAGSDTYLALGLVQYKNNNCKEARQEWKEGYETLLDAQFALHLSQLEAACFKNLDQVKFWNYVYKATERREK